MMLDKDPCAKALIFDIDGTLLDMRGAGRRSFVRALKAVFDWDDDIHYINFAGNTVLRFVPPLVVSTEEIDTLIEKLSLVLDLLS